MLRSILLVEAERSCRTSQDILAWNAARNIHGIDYRIPEHRSYLPLINQARFASSQQERRLYLKCIRASSKHIWIAKHKGALCYLLTGRRLAAPLWPAYKKCTRTVKTL